MGGGNSSINNHTISRQYFDSNNGDVISGNIVINSHTLYQCYDSIKFKEMDGDVEKGDVSSLYGYMNSYTIYQHYVLKSLINYNNRGDIKMNDNFQNGDVRSVIGLINSHTLPKSKEFRKFDEMNRGAKNVDVSGGHCYMNNHTKYESKEHNYIDFTEKSDESTPNRTETENTGLQEGVDIDVVLLASTLHLNIKIYYNN